MKKVVLSGVLSLFIIIVVNYILSLLHFNATRFMLCFVIPIGTLIYGAFLGYVISKQMVKYNVMLTVGMWIFIIVMSLLIIPLTSFVDFMTTYVEANMEINHLFRGAHIGEYLTGSIPVKFLIYRKMILTNMSYTMSGDSISVPLLNYVYAAIQWAGCLVGTLFVLFCEVRGKEVCKTCKRYMNEKIIGISSLEKQDELVAMVKDAVVMNRRITFPEGKACVELSYCSVVIYYCSKCYAGKVVVRQNLIEKENNKTVTKTKDLYKENVRDVRILVAG